MKVFCYNCGAKIEFSASNKPKFCMTCGSPLDPNQAKANTSVHDVEDELEVEEANFSGNISKLEFDYIPEPKNQIKFGEALGTNAGGQVSEDNVKPPSMSQEEFKAQWEKESSSLRKNPSEEGNE